MLISGSVATQVVTSTVDNEPVESTTTAGVVYSETTKAADGEALGDYNYIMTPAVREKLSTIATKLCKRGNTVCRANFDDGNELYQPFKEAILNEPRLAAAGKSSQAAVVSAANILASKLAVEYGRTASSRKPSSVINFGWKIPAG